MMDYTKNRAIVRQVGNRSCLGHLPARKNVEAGDVDQLGYFYSEEYKDALKRYIEIAEINA